MNDIMQRLAAIKAATGMNDAELAACLGPDRNAVYRWKSGARPTPESLDKIAALEAAVESGQVGAVGIARIGWPGRIKEIRKRLGWSQVVLAASLGVTPTVVYRWESGKSVPSLKNRVRLSAL